VWKPAEGQCVRGARTRGTARERNRSGRRTEARAYRIGTRAARLVHNVSAGLIGLDVALSPQAGSSPAWRDRRQTSPVCGRIRSRARRACTAALAPHRIEAQRDWRELLTVRDRCPRRRKARSGIAISVRAGQYGREGRVASAVGGASGHFRRAALRNARPTRGELRIGRRVGRDSRLASTIARARPVGRPVDRRRPSARVPVWHRTA
jgi:hypothetical protein